MTSKHNLLPFFIIFGLFCSFAFITKRHKEKTDITVCIPSTNVSSILRVPSIGEPAAKLDSLQIIGVRALDIKGQVHQIGIKNRRVMPVVLVFIEQGCPISQRYILKLNTLTKMANEKGVQLYGVISAPHGKLAEAQSFVSEFDIQFPVLYDGNGDLAQRLSPSVYPESFVLDINDKLVYYGRINDQYAAVGKYNNTERSADLQKAITAVAKGQSLPYQHKKAVGCVFEPWENELKKVEFNQHIDPILRANCKSCHVPEAIGPFPLRNYEDAARRGQMIQYVTESRIMPIWKAQPGFGKFSNEHYLSDHQIKLIQDWVAQGTPEGKKEDLLPAYEAPKQTWQMGKPDMVLEMEAYKLPAKGDDQYRVFVLNGVVPKGKILKGYEFKAGDNSVVHHSTLFVDYTGTLDQLDQSDPLPGYDAFEKGGTMEFGSAISIGGWAPGVDARFYPDNIGFYIEADAQVAIENHYHLNGKATTDKSKVALYFADEKEVSEFASSCITGSQQVHIKAGDSNYTKTIWTYVPTDIKLIDFIPHMHYIGKEAKLELIEPDGNRVPLLHIVDWDLRWQGVYSLRAPLVVKKGSIIEGTFVYDNSDDNHDNPFYPAQDMFWGWGSTDEMLEFYMTYVPLNFNDYGKMVGAAFAGFEHTYNADERIDVNKNNLTSIYEQFKKTDLYSTKGQKLLLGTVESYLSADVLKMFEKDKTKNKHKANFMTNYAQLLYFDAYFSFDENRLYTDGIQAANILSKVLEKDPSNWNASFALAQLMLDSGEPSYAKQGAEILEATIDYQENIKKENKFARLYNELGKYYYSLRQDSKAESILKRGLNYFPDDADINQTLASEGRIQKKTLN